MAVFSETFTVSTRAGTDVRDISDMVNEAVASSGIAEGIALVFVPGSTAAISAIEYESGAIRDLADAVERMAPEDMRYAHNDKWHDGNGHSHVRSALVGPSFSAPVTGGALALGTWQQIVLLDFDVRARQRRVIVQVVGE